MNVLATGRAAAILGPRRILLSPKVRAESLYIYSDATKTRRQPIDAELLEREGVTFTDAELNDVERVLAVRFAALVDDGEAETLALAAARRIAVLSDDIGAEKVARAEGIPLETTLRLLRDWSVGRNEVEVKEALIGLRARANYAPPRGHVQRSWFISQTEN
jgi:hypothetical protein